MRMICFKMQVLFLFLAYVKCSDADFKYGQRELDNLETFFKNNISPKNEKCPTF